MFKVPAAEDQVSPILRSGQSSLNRMPPQVDGANSVGVPAHILSDALRSFGPIQARSSFDIGYVAFDQRAPRPADSPHGRATSADLVLSTTSHKNDGRTGLSIVFGTGGTSTVRTRGLA